MKTLTRAAITCAAIAVLLVVASVAPASADDSSPEDDAVTVTVLGEVDTNVDGSITEDDLIDQAADLGQDITDQLDQDASLDDPSDSGTDVAPSVYVGNHSTETLISTASSRSSNVTRIVPTASTHYRLISGWTDNKGTRVGYRYGTTA